MAYPEDPVPDIVIAVGGPMDGEELDLSAIPQAERDGVAMISPKSKWGSIGGRSWYSPRKGEPANRWYWDGDTP